MPERGDAIRAMKIETAMAPIRNANRPRPSRRDCALLAPIAPRRKATGVTMNLSHWMFCQSTWRALSVQPKCAENSPFSTQTYCANRRNVTIDAALSNPVPTDIANSDACGSCVRSQPAKPNRIGVLSASRIVMPSASGVRP